MAVTDWTFANLAFTGLVVAGFIGLLTKARLDHRDALRLRGGLLNRVRALFADPRIVIGGDAFPILTGRLPDSRLIRIEIIADTLVCRRLPQLWLVLAVNEQYRRRRPAIGALARPTGAEFYSWVHGLPDWIHPPPWADSPLLVRGNHTVSRDLERVDAAFRDFFSDPAFKEAMIGPHGVRLVRQIAQGDPGSHMLFRQVRFGLVSISPDVIRMMLAQAEQLREALAATRSETA